MTADKNRSEVEAVIDDVKRELRSLFVKSDEQLKKVGNAFKKSGFKEESICEEIKNALKEEIAEGVISTRTIELHCPPEWKHKTKPKNEKPSFSKPVEDGQPQIAVTRTGKSVTMNETSSNTGTDDNHEEGTGDADSKEELTHSSNNEIAPVSKQPEDRKKEVFDSHIPMPFEDLRKDMEAVFQITEGAGNVWFHVIFDVGTTKVTLDFCGNKQQENGAMISTGHGPMRTNS